MMWIQTVGKNEYCQPALLVPRANTVQTQLDLGLLSLSIQACQFHWHFNLVQ